MTTSRKIYVRSFGVFLEALNNLASSEIITHNQKAVVRSVVDRLRQTNEPLYIVGSTINCPEFLRNQFLTQTEIMKLRDQGYVVHVDRGGELW